MEMNEHNIIVIGSSTGGPKTLKEVFLGLPVLNASVIVVQHMPHYINESLKDKLGDRTEMNVKLAEDKDTLEPGTVYIARSELHLKLRNNRKIRLIEGDKVNAVCPSIDVTMLSLRNGPGFHLMGVVLTGMGRDGADGITHVKKLGGTTIAQDQETSQIYGMPKAAFATGDVDFVLTPPHIREKLIEVVGTRRRSLMGRSLRQQSTQQVARY